MPLQLENNYNEGGIQIDSRLLVKKEGFENLPRIGPFQVAVSYLSNGKIVTEKRSLYFESLSKSGNFFSFWTHPENGSSVIEYFGKGDRFLRHITNISTTDGAILYSLGTENEQILESNLLKNGKFTSDRALRPGDNIPDPVHEIIYQMTQKINTLFNNDGSK